MKKISLFATILSVALALTSCENFLDTENLTQKTSGNFPANEKEADEVLTGIYAHLLFESPESSSATYIAQLASDDCLGGNLSYSGNCATNFLLYKDNLNNFNNFSLLRGSANNTLRQCDFDLFCHYYFLLILRFLLLSCHVCGQLPQPS